MQRFIEKISVISSEHRQLKSTFHFAMQSCQIYVRVIYLVKAMLNVRS